MYPIVLYLFTIKIKFSQIRTVDIGDFFHRTPVTRLLQVYYKSNICTFLWKTPPHSPQQRLIRHAAIPTSADFPHASLYAHFCTSENLNSIGTFCREILLYWTKMDNLL